MKTFILNVRAKEKLLEDKMKAANKARYLLYGLALLNFVFGLAYGLFYSVNVHVMISSGIGVIIYILLGAWSEYQAFPAILAGLFVFITLIIASAIVDPHTIYQGIIWKVLIISAFIYGYKGAKDAKEIEKELKSINEAKNLEIEN